MSLFSRVRAFGSAVKSFAVPAATNISPWMFGSMSGGVKEPFAGAWQAGLEEAAGAGTNIMAFSAVYSCINIISSDISRMPARVLRPRERGGREEHLFHPLTPLLAKPNDVQTPLQFWQEYFGSKLWTGNTYVLLLRDEREVINEMYVLDPRKVQPLVASDGSVYYRIGVDPLAGTDRADKVQDFAGGITVAARDILHDRTVCLFHKLVGVSPLFAAGISAMTGARILTNSERFFANMSRASGVLTAPGKVDKDVAKRLQTEWEQNYSGKGLGKTAVLSNGFEFKPMTINATDAMLVDQLRWTVEDVARVYRVPGFKLGDLTKVSYRNSEHMSRDYFQGCLAYHIVAAEQCLNRVFNLPRGTTVEFDLTSLFRTETSERYDAHKTALNAGFKSINEVRAEEDLPGVDGGDEPRVQAQYIPLSMANGEGVNIPGQTPAPSDSSDPPKKDDDDDEKSLDFDDPVLRNMIESFTKSSLEDI